MEGDQLAQQQITPQYLEQFNKICQSAQELVKTYQAQSEQLKSEIVDMVGIYNKKRSPEEAVPVDKIIEITTQYQSGMKEVQTEYNVLSAELKK